MGLRHALATVGALGRALALPAHELSSRDDSFEADCAALADSLALSLPSNVSSSAFVAAGSTLDFDVDPSCTRSSQDVSVDLCRVQLTAATSNASQITMEAWLPANWTGRFLSTGNGGLGGCIQFEDLEYGAALGFAAVGTNNGHDGMSGEPFLNAPDVVEDFAHRAMHSGVVLGKEITRAFYPDDYTKSYYLGCSTGGRQGFKAAQSYPEDFDGIVAGAPAISFNNLTSWSCHFLPLTGTPDAPSFVPLDMWPVVHQDILAQCDGIDGQVDGVLESPDLCDYNVDGLVCAAADNTTGCLTPEQADTVRAVYSPLTGPDGSLAYPRLAPGAEVTEAPQNYFQGERFGAADWFSYAVLADPDWDAASLTPADYARSSDANLFDIATWHGDLSALQARGGRVLHYHGLADGTIASANSPRYYEHVAATMGLAPAQLDDFYRLFRVSGMGHCGGGYGASAIGNQRANAASLDDPDQNVLLAMVRWVEDGVAPDTITGTAFVDDDSEPDRDLLTAQVAFQRNHCRWPLRNAYQSGDPALASSWACVPNEL